MPRAEVGSTKHLANKMKSKGLQRLRWWCEICQKQCRDANGFKCHVQSESHVRQMQIVGENPQKYIQGFSNDFQRDFVTLLRTAHGEKFIGANRFYNEYIRDKEHVHMNATRWSSLTEFVKHLGREGIVNVKEDDEGVMMIAYRDVSAAAVKRREEIREMEAAEARSGASEEKLLKKMAKRAQEDADEKTRILEARKAAQTQEPTPPADEKEEKKEEKEEPKAPVKLGFSLKAKVPPKKPGTGPAAKTVNPLRQRGPVDDSDDRPKKKMRV